VSLEVRVHHHLDEPFGALDEAARIGAAHDRVAPQQVRDIHLTKSADADVTVEKLEHSRHRVRHNPCLAARRGDDAKHCPDARGIAMITSSIRRVFTVSGSCDRASRTGTP